MVERYRHSRCSAALLLSSAVLALVAVALGSHHRGVMRPMEEVQLKEKPLTTHKQPVAVSHYRSARSVGLADGQEHEGPQATPFEAEEWEDTKPGSEAPLLIVKYSGAREGNSSESGAEAAEPGSEAARKGKFIEKFKEWYKGKKEEASAIVINSHLSAGGLDSHGHHHYPHYHQPFVQPIIIGTGSSKGEDPVVITKPVTHYVTVAHPVAFTVTETIVQGHSTPSHVLIHTTISTYMTPSHVYIQEPQTMQPVTISVGHSHETDWGWDFFGKGEVGGSTSDDHVVYVMKPDAATHEAIVIQHPHIVTVPATKPAVTHTVMVQNTKPHVHGYVKGIFAGKGHLEVGRSMTVATPQYTTTYSTSIVKVPGCTHCT